MKKAVFFLFFPLALFLCSFTSRIGANEYSVSGTGQVNRALRGTIISVRQVNVESENGAGTLIGAAAGGVAGSTIGSGSTANILGAIGGAVVGGIAGDAAQGALSKQMAYEYVIQLDNGSLVTITQGTDNLLTPGQKCIIIYGNPSRVIPYNGI